MRNECESKLRLLETAQGLLWRSSYGAVSVDDICQAADVRKGSFYHFFKSKAELAAASLDAGWEETRLHFDKIFSPQDPPLERIEAYFDYVIEGQAALKKKHGHVLGCCYGSIGSELSTQDDHIRTKVMEMSERKCRYLESAIRDAQREKLISSTDDPADLARDLYAFMSGRIQQAKIENSLAPLARIKEGALRLLGARPVSAAV
jgi:TetR/AcrR family transcriptional repressor of nem operon